MKHKLFIAMILTWPLLGLANGAETKSSLTNALKMWEPSTVSISNGVATVRTKENRVTEQIYLAMVGGVCILTLTEPGSLSTLSEVKFLNRHGRQGYIFKGGETDCAEYVNLPIKKTKTWVLSRTHLN